MMGQSQGFREPEQTKQSDFSQKPPELANILPISKNAEVLTITDPQKVKAVAAAMEGSVNAFLAAYASRSEKIDVPITKASFVEVYPKA